MERSNARSYTTGEFAAHFGIKKDTLFYYDKIKLFCPSGVDANGYRTYSASQLEAFWALLSLRELNMPIKELQRYFDSPSPEKLSLLSSTQLEQVETELIKSKKTRWYLQRMEAATKEAMQATIGAVIIQKLPAQKLLCSTPSKIDRSAGNEYWEDIYDRFLSETEFKGPAYIGSVIRHGDLLTGQIGFGRVDRLFVYSNSRKAEIRSAGSYAIFYHKGSYDSIPQAYPLLFSEIHRLGFVIDGDAYEEYLVNELATNNEDDYITKIVVKVNLTNEGYNICHFGRTSG